jgi:NTP pyrophosphatase (non-canonical NTP hydrolase)
MDSIIPSCLTFAEYDEFVESTRVYPREPPLLYTGLGLSDEVGEVCGNLKRVLRDDHGMLTPSRRQSILIELGDSLWYVTAMARELGSSLDEIACLNRSKLLDRMNRGVLNGEGDYR